MGRVHRVLSPDVVPIYDLPNGRSVTVARVKPGALIVVFSPLLDHRFVETLRDMRERGFATMRAS